MNKRGEVKNILEEALYKAYCDGRANNTYIPEEVSPELMKRLNLGKTRDGKVLSTGRELDALPEYAKEAGFGSAGECYLELGNECANSVNTPGESLLLSDELEAILLKVYNDGFTHGELGVGDNDQESVGKALIKAIPIIEARKDEEHLVDKCEFGLSVHEAACDFKDKEWGEKLREVFMKLESYSRLPCDATGIIPFDIPQTAWQALKDKYIKEVG